MSPVARILGVIILYPSPTFKTNLLSLILVGETPLPEFLSLVTALS